MHTNFTVPQWFIGPDFLSSQKILPLVGASKDTLLVTIGDSWTFGGSLLHLIPDSTVDEKLAFTRQHCYGNVLSKKLDAAWINVALPGLSNEWMADQFDILKALLPTLTYKKVIVVITLTELCRELRKDKRDTYFHVTDFSKFNSVKDLLRDNSKYISDKILRNLPENVELVIGRTYVDSCYPDELSKFMIDLDWSSQLLIADNKTPLGHDTSYMLLWSISAINGLSDQLSSIMREEFIHEMNNIMQLSEERIASLHSCSLNIHLAGYQHPTPEGHIIWANHVYDYIMSK
jgi:hypothetical protein